MPHEALERRALLRMEGAMARWYARQRGSAPQIEAYRVQAAQLTAGLPDGAEVLEVAPGPGYLSIEIARTGRFHVTGLDISRSFVEIATWQARRAGWAWTSGTGPGWPWPGSGSGPPGRSASTTSPHRAGPHLHCRDGGRHDGGPPDEAVAGPVRATPARARSAGPGCAPATSAAAR